MASINSSNKFKVGNSYYADGINMSGKKVVVKCKLIRLLSKVEMDKYQGRYDCVTQSGSGIKCLGNLADLRISR